METNVDIQIAAITQATAKHSRRWQKTRWVTAEIRRATALTLLILLTLPTLLTLLMLLRAAQ
jgi:ABC-type uncharacterized transport system involved in gliding motility auxiliary subunit